MAEQHEVLAAGLGAEVGVEGEQSVDAVGGGAEVIGHDFGGFERDPAEMLVDLLKGDRISSCASW